MKITHVALKVGLLSALICPVLGLTGCGGSEAKKSSAAELDAFKGNPNTPEAKADIERMRAESAAGAAKAQAQPAPAQR